MLQCIKTCVLNGSRQIRVGQVLPESEVPEAGRVYFEERVSTPKEMNRTLQTLNADFCKIEQKIKHLEDSIKLLCEKLDILDKPQDEKEKSSERIELERQANELNIEFNPRIGDKKLRERIDSVMNNK